MREELNGGSVGRAKSEAAHVAVEIVLINETVGLGVRSTRRHERGSVVETFQGQVSPHMLQHSLQISQFQHLLDHDLVGYLTHSCDPNCVLDMQRLCLLALKDTPAGEVLTIDYAVTEDVLYKQFACSCEAANCRDWVTGRREPVNAKGRAYLTRMQRRRA